MNMPYLVAIDCNYKNDNVYMDNFFHVIVEVADGYGYGLPVSILMGMLIFWALPIPIPIPISHGYGYPWVLFPRVWVYPRVPASKRA